MTSIFFSETSVIFHWNTVRYCSTTLTNFRVLAQFSYWGIRMPSSYSSRSRSYFTSDSQSVCLGAEPTLGLVTRYYFLSEGCCLKAAVLSLWGALSDERTSLQFAVKSLNGPRNLLSCLCETRQQISENNLRAESNIWSQIPEWARYLDILTDCLTVSCNVTSTSISIRVAQNP
jgi:hypothetical protein